MRMKAILVVVAMLGGCAVDGGPVEQPGDASTGHMGCSDVCGQSPVIVSVIENVTSYSCVVDWATTPVICEM